jgi:hypothetical protein
MRTVVRTIVAPFLIMTACTAAPTDAADTSSGHPSPAAASLAVPTVTSARPTVATAPAVTSTPRVTAAAASRALPAFTWSQRRVTAANLPHSWRRGCPVAPSALRALTLRFYGFDGRSHDGVLVVAASSVTDVVAVFRKLYAERFPIRRMIPVDAYGGSDDRSVAADNTAGFNCRKAVTTGPASWSMHAYGLAIDINPVENPYIEGGRVIPPAGSAFVNRSRVRPGMALRGTTVVAAFATRGWKWGGTWSSPDYQHFSTNGR